MSNMKFKYFRDPDNFAYKIKEVSNCSLCDKIGLWFDARGFYGINEIECICDECLLAGRLKELEIETNDAQDGSSEDIETIIYKTPPLPTWQDRDWLFINNSYCIFEKIASKTDFESKEEFQASFSESDKNDSDLDWLWEVLPDKQITNHEDGNYDVSVYLFTCDGRKHCTWDAN